MNKSILNKDKKKTTKGITLIALVITIIVLLILAGVSIAMLTGENGLLTKATNAKTQSTEAEEKEMIGIAYLANKINNQEESNLQEEIDKLIGRNKAEVMEGDPLKILFKDTENLYEIDADGKIIKIEGNLDERGYLIVESTSDEWEYTVNSNGLAILNKYIGENTEVTVPNYINENGTLIRVVTIKAERSGYNIFGGKSNTKKTKVTISDGIENIGYYCFVKCTGLKSINIPNSVKSIGNSAFNGCSNLEEINIASNVISIDKENVSSTKWFADLKANNPNSLIYAGKALIDYTGTGYTMPIKEDTIKIGKSAFEDCAELKIIEIPNSVNIISDYAFENCTGLENINIPKNVITIGDYAFHSCTNLKSIEISESVTTIGNYAFCACTSLKSINIPRNINKIGNSAFKSCSGLEEVNIQGAKTIGESAFYECTNITSIILGEGIESIGVDAFGRCYKIEELIFPESLIELGEAVWASDILLDKVVFKGTTPPNVILTFCMGFPAENIKAIYVPAESVEDYKEIFSDIANGTTSTNIVDLIQANPQS